MSQLTLFDAFLLLLVLGSCAALLLGDWAARARARARARTPRPSTPAEAQSPPQSPAPPAVPRLADLLLVDDSAVARAKLRRLFEGAGYRVQLACDGVEALAWLAQGRFGMMVTDLEMPNLDGVALISHCLGQPDIARMPIMAVSGHEDLRSKFSECGDICGVHRKPWVDDILLNHVAALIGPPAAAAPAALQVALAEH